jgi:hypothetical protein
MAHDYLFAKAAIGLSFAAFLAGNTPNTRPVNNETPNAASNAHPGS